MRMTISGFGLIRRDSICVCSVLYKKIVRDREEINSNARFTRGSNKISR